MSLDEQLKSERSILNRPYVLVAVGFGLGYLARLVLGPPAGELEAVHRRFERPMPVAKPEVDVPLDRETGS
jgi:hypothetical protein